MNDTRSLPLFPLRTVLFPGSSLSLQIFEPRYLKMLSDCLEGDQRLGIILIRKGREVGGRAETFSVGTMARIDSVGEMAEGRIFVSLEGEERFRLHSREEDNPYPFGRIEILEDELGGEGVELDHMRRSVRGVTQQMLNLASGLSGGWSPDIWIPEPPTALSYFVPKLLRTTPKRKQALLEASTTMQRLTDEEVLILRQMKTLRSQVTDELRGRFSPN